MTSETSKTDMTSKHLGLTAEQVAAFRRDGFVVINDFVSATDCAALRERAESLEESLRQGADESAVFSTTDQSHASHDWFLDSGDKVRGFFESSSDRLNKIGHAMHDLDPVFDHFSRQLGLAEVTASIGMTDPRLVQSMYIYKHPGVGGEVTWHTDHTFLWTEPRSVVGFWVAIDDATTENGCMWAIPGGHQIATKSRFVRADRTTSTEVFDDEPYPIESAIALEAPSGTLIVLDGQLPHWSDHNTSSAPRQAYTLHVIDGAAHWSENNWLQRDPVMPFRGF